VESPGVTVPGFSLRLARAVAQGGDAVWCGVVGWGQERCGKEQSVCGLVRCRLSPIAQGERQSDVSDVRLPHGWSRKRSATAFTLA